MNNVIRFEKPNDEELSSGWLAVCDVIDRDFTKAGLQSYAQQFKDEFKPVFDLLSGCAFEMPNIAENDPNPAHQAWRKTILKSIDQIKSYGYRLLGERYARELEIFLERNVPIV